MERSEELQVELAAGLITKGVRLVLPDGGLSPVVTAVITEDDDLGNPLLNRLEFDDGGPGLRVALTATVRAVGSGVVGSGSVHPTEPDGAPSDRPALVTGGLLSLPSPGAAAIPAPETLAADPAGATPSDATHTPAPSTPTPHTAAESPSEDPAVAAARELIPPLEDTPEQLIEDISVRYPGRGGLQNLADRLVKGINVKSGSCLADLRAFAQDLFLEYQDSAASLNVADLLNVLQFDGNPARWTHTEASLALSSFVADELGEHERAEAYRLLLRAPEEQELDPFRSRLEAKIRQRRLNEPNLYDKEVFRAIDSGNHEAEREWRVLRLESLLHLKAHGGSQTLAPEEVDRRIRMELDLVRG
ncbi:MULTISPECIES: DUF6707 family protein [Arthrobacter]|uniref:DUF6707 family protein n=2 Tax=Arthrobacter TaxID=1663 RepID=A0ABU9KHP3_9MICC|nr:DUF6707 family protein [Arthrobacter sp. YJM1]MDP5226560.1 hypothetical protein [Arthrobacter sp. YJM1]